MFSYSDNVFRERAALGKGEVGPLTDFPPMNVAALAMMFRLATTSQLLGTVDIGRFKLDTRITPPSSPHVSPDPEAM